MALSELISAYESRQVYARAKASRAIYYLGLDTPVELIAAAGFTPIALAVDPACDLSAAAPFGEGVGHPYLRAIVAALADESWGKVQRLIISTTPSFYVGLHAFLREAQRAQAGFADLEIHMFDLCRAQTEGAETLRVRAVRQVKEKLEKWRGAPITSDELADASATQNRVRTLQAHFQAQRCAQSGISGCDALAVFGAEGAMDLGAYISHLETVLAEWTARETPAGPRVIYSGTPTFTRSFYARIEEARQVVVADDQDCGSRAIGRLVADSGDPLAALARRYFDRDPAPARWDTSARVDYLLRLARAARAERVVFRFAPWDHPPAWDYPAQQRALEACGIACELLDPNDV